MGGPMRQLLAGAVILLALSFSSVARAQITNVGNTTSTPIPGAGHDYIHMLSETVNPSNGSVSLRIQVPVPQGRGLTIPFSFDYDSNGTTHLQYFGNGVSGWAENNAFLAIGGWGYSLPQLNVAYTNAGVGSESCFYESDYVFQDPSGGRHALGLEVAGYASNTSKCGSDVLTGGDDSFTAQTSANSVNSAVVLPPVTVSDSDGTIYYFGSPGVSQTSLLPTYIEDRNGNKVLFTTSGNIVTMTDTLSRAAISSSGFGVSGTTDTLSVSGLASPYQVTWETVPAKYTMTHSQMRPDAGCTFPAVNQSLIVVKSITLPNGQQYQFSYDPTYGYLSQITYPSGGWIKYTWKLSDQLSELSIFPDQFLNPYACIYI
jgi:hypothetical protein